MCGAVIVQECIAGVCCKCVLQQCVHTCAREFCVVKCTRAVCSTVTRCAHITATHSCNTPLQHTPATPSCDTLLQHTPATECRHVARVLTTASHYCNTQLHHTPTPNSCNTLLQHIINNLPEPCHPCSFWRFFLSLTLFLCIPPHSPPFFWKVRWRLA